jgi:DNA polymerase-4
MAERWVFHIDLDAFFANAEVLRRPDLRDKPVIVGGSVEGRGVVSSATYAARAHGVRSAMPVAHARRLCPDAIFLPGDFPYYRELSARFRAILHDTSPIVQIASIDEAYLEATGLVASRESGFVSREKIGAGAGAPSLSEPSHDSRTPTPDFRLPTPGALAIAIKSRLLIETGLTCSIGIAPNKTLAKIASDLRKPDGLVFVPQGAAAGAAFLAPLPVGALPGIGPKAQVRLDEFGIRHLGELAAASPALLRRIFGERIATIVSQRVRGVDDRPLETESTAKTLGHERTFATDIADITALRQVIRDLAEQDAAQLRRAGLGARSVSLKLRDERFETLGRQRALGGSTELAAPIRAVAEELLDELLGASGTPWYGRRIRLLGVRVAGLGPLARQLDLFDGSPQRAAKLNAALDRLNDRFGPNAIGTASRTLIRPPHR